jgi:hypothetical protein
VYEPVVTVRRAAQRLGGATRLASPERIEELRGELLAAHLDRAICDALNAGSLPDAERQRLGLLLLNGGAR